MVAQLPHFAGTARTVESQLNSLGDPMPIDLQFPEQDGGVMSKFERLLEAGSTELPDCRCAAEMHLIAISRAPGGETEIRIFRCPNCNHELRLTAWPGSASAT